MIQPSFLFNSAQKDNRLKEMPPKSLLFFLCLSILSLAACAQKKELSQTPNQTNMYPIEKSDAEWKAELTPTQYQILRKKGTERAFTGKYWNHFEKGIYACAGCRTPLFTSETKYHSSCGWPSYFDGMKDKIEEKLDKSYGMIRTEVLCKTCGGHLGHVFNDGPPPTGIRYCINSESLVFLPQE
jgi:peptide-methionine (R)-S-oxide reductase